MRSRSIALRNLKIAVISTMSAVMFFVSGSIILSSIKTQAAPAEPSYKYYTSIQLQKGDTLWNIAKKYMTVEYTDTDEYIAELCTLNRISAGDPIHSGQYLTVPYYSDKYYE